MRDAKAASDLVKRYSLTKIITECVSLRKVSVFKETHFSLSVKVDNFNRYWPVFEIYNWRNEPADVKVPFDYPIRIDIIPFDEVISLRQIILDGTRMICFKIAVQFVARADYIILSSSFNEKGEPCLNIEFVFSQDLIFKESVPYEKVKNFIALEE